MPFPDTESPQEKSSGIPHRATESQGGCLLKGDEGVKYQGGRSWNMPGMMGTESHVTGQPGKPKLNSMHPGPRAASVAFKRAESQGSSSPSPGHQSALTPGLQAIASEAVLQAPLVVGTGGPLSKARVLSSGESRGTCVGKSYFEATAAQVERHSGKRLPLGRHHYGAPLSGSLR